MRLRLCVRLQASVRTTAELSALRQRHATLQRVHKQARARSPRGSHAKRPKVILPCELHSASPRAAASTDIANACNEVASSRVAIGGACEPRQRLPCIGDAFTLLQADDS
eukprot:6198620-Pleurochrysis_carterae.AAC.1